MEQSLECNSCNNKSNLPLDPPFLITGLQKVVHAEVNAKSVVNNFPKGKACSNIRETLLTASIIIQKISHCVNRDRKSKMH